MTNYKPTEEELQEGINKAVEELEKETPEENEDTQDEETDTEETNNEDESEGGDDGGEKTEESEEDEESDTEDENSEDQEDEIDYKKKFSESSKEAQKINAKNKKIIEAVDDAESIKEPTEEELQGEYSEWDVMTDTEKMLAKEAFISKKWRERISKAREEAKKIEKWEESVTKFVDDPETFIKYPKLEGKQDLFREYASREENSSVPFKLLVNSFLYEQSTKVKKNKGSQMETGTAGPSNKGAKTDTKLSPLEAQKLMKTDFKKYKELLIAGKISNI